MEKYTDRNDPGHVARAVEATEAICSLQAIASQDWCDDAANAVSTMFHDALVGVAICEIDRDGMFSRVEAVGAAGPDPSGERLTAIRRRFEACWSLGWSFGEEAPRAPRASRVQDLPLGSSWQQSDAGRLWGEIGVRELLVAVAPLTLARPSRVIVVEVGIPGGAEAFSRSEAPMLAGVMRALARRALSAFGATPISPSRMLTRREQEVLSRLVLGESVKEIAQRLCRSPHTVHDYVKSLHRKLEASSRGALVAKALGHSGEDNPPADVRPTQEALDSQRLAGAA